MKQKGSILSEHNESKGFAHLLLLIILIAGLVAGVYLVTSGNPLKLFSKAADKKKAIDLESEFVKGEVLVKFKPDAGKLIVKPGLGIQSEDIEKKVIPFSALDEKSTPNVLKTVNQKYQIKQVEKVFKGTGERLTASVDLLRVYKITFSEEVNEKEIIDDLKKSSQIEYAEPNFIVAALQNPTPLPTSSSKRVFVTSTTYTGNLGGLAGADTKCQQRAEAASLGGTWKAWLSSSTVNAKDIIPNTEYRRIDGVVVANNKDDLLDGTLDNPIDKTEAGAIPSGGGSSVSVFTGTAPSGGLLAPSGKPCSDWLDDTYRAEMVLGYYSSTTASWTANEPYTYGCDYARRLYCFEISSAMPSPTPTPTPTPTAAPAPPNRPDDPYYPQMWNLSKIKAEDAWAISKGSKDVKVAILDTGIDFTHQELGETKNKERSFEQINKDPLWLMFAASSRVSQTLAMDKNRLAYFSGGTIYVYSFDTKTTESISLPSTFSYPRIIRLALKDNLLIYAAYDNYKDYYSKIKLYLYNLSTREHKLIPDSFFMDGGYSYPFEIGNGKVMWSLGAHVDIYDMLTNSRYLQSNPNSFPRYQYISFLKASDDVVAYSYFEVNGCFKEIVIHHVDTNQRQKFYPPNIGPVLDFKDNKVLYKGCGGTSPAYIFDITTGQSQPLSYTAQGSQAKEKVRSSGFVKATTVVSPIDEGIFGDGVIFLSDEGGSGITAFDQNSNKSVKINLLKGAYNFVAEGKRACFVSNDANIYCHSYDSNFDYSTPQSFFNNRVTSGYNFVNDSNNPIDRNGHGTHVAGTIGASVNNSIGVSGINWDVNLMAVKVLDDSGKGTTDIVVQGIKYAADNGAKVINMSFGGSYPCSSSQVYQDAINYARERNVTVVAAAGNDSTDASNHSPASCKGVITVGATGSTNERSYYSNFGSVVDIAAPGGDVYKCTDSASCKINSTYLEGQYASFQGTSMAAPHITGIVALMLALKPTLSPDEIEEILKSNGDNLAIEDWPVGKLVNAYKTLAALNPSPTPAPSPKPSSCTPCRADINKDGKVDQAGDFPRLQACFNKFSKDSDKDGNSCEPADINKDSKINLTDFNCLKINLNKTCQ